jgi:hypothetical protein
MRPFSRHRGSFLFFFVIFSGYVIHVDESARHSCHFSRRRQNESDRVQCKTICLIAGIGRIGRLFRARSLFCIQIKNKRNCQINEPVGQQFTIGSYLKCFVCKGLPTVQLSTSTEPIADNTGEHFQNEAAVCGRNDSAAMMGTKGSIGEKINLLTCVMSTCFLCLRKEFFSKSF